MSAAHTAAARLDPVEQTLYQQRVARLTAWITRPGNAGVLRVLAGIADGEISGNHWDHEDQPRRELTTADWDVIADLGDDALVGWGVNVTRLGRDVLAQARQNEQVA